MTDAEAENMRLLLPGLESFYRQAIPISWLVIRVTIGFVLVMHGWPKVLPGPSSFALRYVQMGLSPGEVWAWADTLIEVVGGVAIILGLFTRFFAAAVAIQMAIIMMVYLPNGFAWTNRGYEFVLMWGLVSFAIALRGGGPYSLDRRIGIEL
jgi:putative oxidoreductase